MGHLSDNNLKTNILILKLQYHTDRSYLFFVSFVLLELWMIFCLSYQVVVRMFRMTYNFRNTPTQNKHDKLIAAGDDQEETGG
jgi:hypothetical protein